MFLQIEVDFPNHPKSKRLGVLLGNPVAWAYIQKLWGFAFAFQKDGDLTSYTPEEIEGFVDWPGEPGKFYSAAVRVGFIDECESDGGRWLHNWKKRQGKWLDKIEADRHRKAESRAGVRRTSDGQSAGRPMDSPQDVTRDVHAPGSVTAPVPDPIRSDPIRHDLTPLGPARVIHGATSTAPPRCWTAHRWLQVFGDRWTAKYQKFYGGGEADAKASGRLADLLAAMPEADRLEAQQRSGAMISEFFDDDGREVRQARHPFVFFVARWNGLRIPTEKPKDTGPHYPRLVPLPEPETEGPRRGDPNASQWAREQLAKQASEAKAADPPGAA